MIIQRVEIKSFGKLENFKLEFSSRASVLRADNESGKSTILEFIFACLFGMPARGSSDPMKSKRLRYRSWNTDKMAGSMDVSKDGKEYRIVVNFAKTAKGDKIHLYDLYDMSEIDLKGTVPASFLMNMDAGSFRNTVYIPQMSVPIDLDDSKREEIIQTLSQLSLGSIDEESFTGAKLLLESAYKKIISRGQKSLVSRIENDIRDKEQLLAEARVERDSEIRERLTLESLQSEELKLASELNKQERVERELAATITHLRVSESEDTLLNSRKRLAEISMEKDAESSFDIKMNKDNLNEFLDLKKDYRQKLDKFEIKIESKERDVNELYTLAEQMSSELKLPNEDRDFLLKLQERLIELKEKISSFHEHIDELKNKRDDLRKKSEFKLNQARESYMEAVNKYVKVSEEQNSILGELRHKHAAALEGQLDFEKSLSEVRRRLSEILAETDNERNELEQLRAEQEYLREEESSLNNVDEEIERLFLLWYEQELINNKNKISEDIRKEQNDKSSQSERHEQDERVEQDEQNKQDEQVEQDVLDKMEETEESISSDEVENLEKKIKADSDDVVAENDKQAKEKVKYSFSKIHKFKTNIDVKEKSIKDKEKYSLEEKEQMAISYLRSELEKIEDTRIELYSERAIKENELKRQQKFIDELSQRFMNIDKRAVPKLAEFIIYGILLAFSIAAFFFLGLSSDFSWADNEKINIANISFSWGEVLDNLKSWSWIFLILAASVATLLGMRLKKYLKLRRFESIDEAYELKKSEINKTVSGFEEEFNKLTSEIKELEKKRAELSICLRNVEDLQKERMSKAEWIKERMSQIRARVFEINLKLQKNLPRERAALKERDKLLEKKDELSKPVEKLQTDLDNKHKLFTEERERLSTDRDRKKEYFDEIQEKDRNFSVFEDELKLKDELQEQEQLLFKLRSEETELLKRADLLAFKYKRKSYKELLDAINTQTEREKRYLIREDELLVDVKELSDEIQDLLSKYQRNPWSELELDDRGKSLLSYDDIELGQSGLEKARLLDIDPVQGEILDEFIDIDSSEEQSVLRRQMSTRLNVIHEAIFVIADMLSQEMDFLENKYRYIQSRELEEQSLIENKEKIEASIAELIEEDRANFSEEQSLAFVENIKRLSAKLGTEAEAKKAYRDFELGIRETRQNLEEIRHKMARQDEFISQRFKLASSKEFIETELADLRNDLDRAKSIADSLELAGEYIDLSLDELRKNFWPILRQRAVYILSVLTSGKYKDIVLEKDLTMKIFDEDGISHEASYLSGAAYEQIYLALRISLASILTEQSSLPLLIDDVSVQFDDTRLETCLLLLDSCLNNDEDVILNNEIDDIKKKLRCFTQIIFFTCQRRVGELAKDKCPAWEVREFV